jgi:hypothetical protein
MSKNNVFISYARGDKGWAEWLRERLLRYGFEVSTDATSVAPGESFISELNRTIASSDVVVVLLSPNYFQSKWSQYETAAAAASDVPIIPVLVEPCEGQGFLRYYNLADLTSDRDTGLRAVIRAAEELPAHRPV